jgi:hypothetical protein
MVQAFLYVIPLLIWAAAVDFSIGPVSGFIPLLMGLVPLPILAIYYVLNKSIICRAPDIVLRLLVFSVGLALMTVFYEVCFGILILGTTYKLWRLATLLAMAVAACAYLIGAYKIISVSEEQLPAWYSARMRVPLYAATLLAIAACGTFFSLRDMVPDAAFQAHSDGQIGFPGESFYVSGETQIRAVQLPSGEAAFVVNGPGRFELQNPPRQFPPTLMAVASDRGATWESEIKYRGFNPSPSRKQVALSAKVKIPADVVVEKPTRLTGKLVVPIAFAELGTQNNFSNRTAEAATMGVTTIWVFPLVDRDRVSEAWGDRWFMWLTLIIVLFVGWVCSVWFLAVAWDAK